MAMRTIESPALDIMGRAYSTYQKTMEDMNKLNENRIKLGRDKEQADAKKKKAQADLEVAKLDGSMKKNDLAIQEVQMKEYFKHQDTINKGKNLEMDIVEDELKTIADQSINIAQTVKNSPEGQAALGGYESPLTTNKVSSLEPTYKGGHYGFKRAKDTKESATKISAADKALGALNDSDITDRKALEKEAEVSLGYGWQEKFPEALKIIGKKAGPDIERFKQVIKEKGIKTGRQAVEYLVSMGMEQDRAIAWVKKNIK